MSTVLYLLIGLMALVPLSQTTVSSGTRMTPRSDFLDFLIREVDGGLTRAHVSSSMASVQENGRYTSARTNGQQAFNAANVLPYGMYVFDLLFYFRAVPKRHWSCCMLGVLAGDKGYHCHVDLYASDIIRRNFNRVHPRAMDWYRSNSGSRRRRAMKTMRAFSKCVNINADQFKTCCTAATLQKAAFQTWQRHQNNPNSGNDRSWRPYRRNPGPNRSYY